MAKVKFKIDENWDGKEHKISGEIIRHPRKTVTVDGETYGPGDIFDAPKELGEGRIWLIPQSKIVDTEEKPKKGKPKKEKSNGDKGEEKVQS